MLGLIDLEVNFQTWLLYIYITYSLKCKHFNKDQSPNITFADFFFQFIEDSIGMIPRRPVVGRSAGDTK